MMSIPRRAVTTAFPLMMGLVTAGQAAGQTLPQPLPSIVTQGEAVIKRAPDRAWITVATEIHEGKAADARRKSAELMTTITAAIKATGLAADAFRTTGYSLTPELEWAAGRSSVKGYVVRSQLEVRVDDIEKVGDVLDAANGPKNAGLSIIGPRFDLKNQREIETEALKAAVEAAMVRAQAMASGARRSLGQILRIETVQVGTNMPPPRPMLRQTMTMDAQARGGAAAVPETPIAPGEIEITATVTLTVVIQS